MCDPIKSADLCERCFYSFERFCLPQGKMYGGCPSCKMDNGDACKCLTIKENTPCPYFEEANEMKWAEKWNRRTEK